MSRHNAECSEIIEHRIENLTDGGLWSSSTFVTAKTITFTMTCKFRYSCSMYCYLEKSSGSNHVMYLGLDESASYNNLPPEGDVYSASTKGNSTATVYRRANWSETRPPGTYVFKLRTATISGSGSPSVCSIQTRISIDTNV